MKYTLCLVSVLATASLTTLLYLSITLPDVRDMRKTLEVRTAQADNVHSKMMAFMSSGPRYTRQEGLLVCEALNSLYLEQELEAPLSCE